MAFINLRRKKGIYLGGFAGVAILFLSLTARNSVSPSSMWCSAKPSAARSDRLVSPAIKRSLIRRCHFWRNHFRVVSAMTRRDATRRWALRSSLSLPFSLIPFAHVSAAVDRVSRISERPGAFLRRAVFNWSLRRRRTGSRLDDVDGRFAITRSASSARLPSILRISDGYCQKYARLSRASSSTS